MDVLFISDHSVTPSQPGVLRTWQLARHLGEQGDEVVVVAPRAYFPFARSGQSWPVAEAIPPGVRVKRMRTPEGGGGLGWRMASYAAQALEATRAVVQAGGTDGVVGGLAPRVLGPG